MNTVIIKVSFSILFYCTEVTLWHSYNTLIHIPNAAEDTWIKLSGYRYRYKSCNSTVTHPGSDLTLPQSTLLADFVWTAKLLHVFTEVTLRTVLSPQTGITLTTHSGRAFNLKHKHRYETEQIVHTILKRIWEYIFCRCKHCILKQFHNWDKDRVKFKRI